MPVLHTAATRPPVGSLGRLLSALVVLGVVTSLGCSGAAPDGDWRPDEIRAEVHTLGEGVISDPSSRDYGVALTPDMQTVVFTRRPDGERQQLWSATWQDTAWSAAEPLPFTGGTDETPSFSADGRTLYFSSRRPGAIEEQDVTDNVWQVELAGGVWGTPQPVGGDVNQTRGENSRWPTGSELNPQIGPGGALYFWSRGADFNNSANIYRSAPMAGGFGSPAVLPAPVNSEGFEGNFAFGPDGLLVFQGYGRDEAFGGDDLFFSFQMGDRWTEPQLLPAPVNTEGFEGFPAFSPDGRFFFFASDRSSRDGRWQIHFVELALLELRKISGFAGQ